MIVVIGSRTRKELHYDFAVVVVNPLPLQMLLLPLMLMKWEDCSLLVIYAAAIVVKVVVVELATVVTVTSVGSKGGG